jgi:hypothetical protein
MRRHGLRVGVLLVVFLGAAVSGRAVAPREAAACKCQGNSNVWSLIPDNVSDDLLEASWPPDAWLFFAKDESGSTLTDGEVKIWSDTYGFTLGLEVSP